MFLWSCSYKNCEWCCYVIAKTKGKAKSLFQDYWRDGEYIDIRVYKVKEAKGFVEGIHDMDDDVLKQLGVRYLTEEELERIGVL